MVNFFGSYDLLVKCSVDNSFLASFMDFQSALSFVRRDFSSGLCLFFGLFDVSSGTNAMFHLTLEIGAKRVASENVSTPGWPWTVREYSAAHPYACLLLLLEEVEV